MSGTHNPELDPLFRALKRTGTFVWDNLVSMIGISICWFLAVLPVVTIGPATVGAYRAVLSLKDRDTVDRAAVFDTVRSQFAHATLLALIPLVFAAITVGYVSAYVSTGAVTTGLVALVAAYATIYAGIVAVPTLIGVANGENPADAVIGGYLWTAEHAMAAVALGVVTAILFVVASLLTVAVALIFAGFVFAFHIEFVDSLSEHPASNSITTQ